MDSARRTLIRRILDFVVSVITAIISWLRRDSEESEG